MSSPARWILMGLLLVHSLLSLVIMKEVGLLTLFPPYRDLHTYQLFSDLAVAIGVIYLLMFLDIRKRKRSLLPWFLSGLSAFFLGSIAPLVHLLVDRNLFNSD